MARVPIATKILASYLKGKAEGKAEEQQSTLTIRQRELIHLTQAAAALAEANASLTYSLSRIADKLL